MVGKDCRKLISRPAVFFTEQENIEIFILQKKRRAVSDMGLPSALGTRHSCFFGLWLNGERINPNHTGEDGGCRA